jgi:hypothetical protein
MITFFGDAALTLSLTGNETPLALSTCLPAFCSRPHPIAALQH